MSKHLPPGPFNINAVFNCTWRHYWRLRMDPIGFATKLTRSYGDLSYFRVFGNRVILVNHPQFIRQVLVSEANNFPKFARVRNHLQKFTGDGLLVAEGENWRQQRISSQKIFRSSRMDSFAKLTASYTRQMLTRWSGLEQIEVEHEMTLLMQAIMGRGFFGLELRPGDKIADAVRILSDLFHRESREIFNWPDWLPLKSKKQKRETLKLINDALGKTIRDRIKSNQRHDDFLDMLLQQFNCDSGHCSAAPHDLPIDKIQEQLLTMYVAGFHTTSVALAWLFFAVARHPQVQENLRREITGVCGEETPNPRHLEGLRYGQMVVNESLRLYPPAWELFARQAVDETELGEYRIPAASLILIMPFITQRDPRFFRDPEKFDPLRFSAEREHEIPAFAYLPFGLGPRHCIGKSMALMQMRLVMATVLQKFELKLDGSNAERVRFVPRVSLRPAGGIKLSLRRLSVTKNDANASTLRATNPAARN